MAQPLRPTPASGLPPRTSGAALGSMAGGHRGLAPTSPTTSTIPQTASGRPLSIGATTGLQPGIARAVPTAGSQAQNHTARQGLAGSGPSGSTLGASPAAADRLNSSTASARPVAHSSAAPATSPAAVSSRVSESASVRPLSAQSSRSGVSTQGKPDLRRWTDEDLRRQIQLLEQGLKSAVPGVSGAQPAAGTGAGAAVSTTATVLTATGAASAIPQGSLNVKTPSYQGPVTAISGIASAGGVSTVSTSGGRNSSPPPESTDEEASRRILFEQCHPLHVEQTNQMRKRVLESQPGEPPAKLEAQLSLKERQVVELRAQIARCERQLYGGTAVGAERPENEHTDPERTGPPGTPGAVMPAPLATPGTGSVSALPGASPLPMAGMSVDRMISLASVSNAGGSTAGANTPAPSTPGGRGSASTLNKLEGELAWVVKQMETHRQQIQHHQQQLSALEKRHAEIVSTIAARGIGGGRSPASTVVSAVADRLEQAVEDGIDAAVLRMVRRDLPEGSPGGDGMIRREGAERFDDQLSLPSSLNVSATRAAERAARGLGARGTSRPTSASSAASHGSREVGSAVGSTVSRGSKSSNPFAAKGSLDGVRNRSRGPAGAPSREQTEQPWVGQASPSADRDAWPPGDPLGNWPAGQGAEDAEGASLRSFGKSYEAERIVYLLTQFGMRRPLRIPFVPLDAPADGEGRPYLHGSLEVRLCLSEDGNRLMVRVGAGPAGVGGRLFEIEEFVNRAEAIEARKWQRPSSIAEETEFNAPSSPHVENGSQNGSAAADVAASPTLDVLLGKGKDTSSSALPWKKLFKSHWS